MTVTVERDGAGPVMRGGMKTLLDGAAGELQEASLSMRGSSPSVRGASPTMREGSRMNRAVEKQRGATPLMREELMTVVNRVGEELLGASLLMQRELTVDGAGEELQRSFYCERFRLPDFAGGDVGAVVWPAGLVLTGLLLKENWVRERRVVELGAAAGLCGIVAAQECGASFVWTTDFNLACIQAAQENITFLKLQHKVKAVFLDWTKPIPDDVLFDHAIILGATIVYEKDHAVLVSNFLLKCFQSRADAAFISLHEEHVAVARFPSELAARGLFFEVIDRRSISIDDRSAPCHIITFRIAARERDST